MTLNFQNRIVFPAPETSYTTQSAFGQVIYLPRNIMKRVEHKFNQSATTAKQNANSGDGKNAQTKDGSQDSISKDEQLAASTTASNESKDAAYLEKSQANLESHRLASEKRAGQAPVFVSEADTLE